MESRIKTPFIRSHALINRMKQQPGALTVSMQMIKVTGRCNLGNVKAVDLKCWFIINNKANSKVQLQPLQTKLSKLGRMIQDK